jgi:ABC-type transport system involved in cytochrome c biogenesis permease component
MPNTIPDPLVQSILLKEKRKAYAKAVLNRPGSIVPVFLVVAVLAGLGSYLLLEIQHSQAPLWTAALLVGGFALSIVNALDLWTTRRRLEAAITLLQLQQEPDI